MVETSEIHSRYLADFPWDPLNLQVFQKRMYYKEIVEFSPILSVILLCIILISIYIISLFINNEENSLHRKMTSPEDGDRNVRHSVSFAQNILCI